MKVLIIGASGYLGNVIYNKLKACERDGIYGTCCNSSNLELLKVDVLNNVDIMKMLLLKPDIIVWSIYDFEEEMALSQRGLYEILNEITQDVRLIYVSTTVGSGKDQTENIAPHRRTPDEYLSKYVNGKICGESMVRKHTNHVIVRSGSIYGYGYDGRMDSRMKELLEMSTTGISYSRTANMYASFVNVEDLANAIIELAYNNFTGIINIAGERPVSHFDFNIYLASLIGIDSEFIIPDYKKEAVYNNLNSDKRKLELQTLVRDI